MQAIRNQYAIKNSKICSKMQILFCLANTNIAFKALANNNYYIETWPLVSSIYRASHNMPSHNILYHNIPHNLHVMR